jgi:hypothetical protein
MSRQTLLLHCMAGVLAICLFATLANAGDVQGFVRDEGGTAPDNGISGVRVKFRPKKGETFDGGITNAKGKYRVPNVPNGEYTLVFDKVGYVPRPHDKTKTTIKDGNNDIHDIMLMRSFGTYAYYQVIAKKFVAKGNAAPSKSEMYANQWIKLREINFPPTSKAGLAYWITQKDKEAEHILPALNDYLQVDVKNIDLVAADFKKALVGQADLPSKASLAEFKVGDEVLTDIVLHELRGDAGSASQRRAFLEQFESMWQGTKPAKQVKQWYQMTTESAQ